MKTLATVPFVAMALFGCIRPAEERAFDDLEVGQAADGSLSVMVEDGQAQVRSIEAGRISLWAQAPELSLTIALESGAPAEIALEVENCMPGSVLSSAGGALLMVRELDSERATICRFAAELPVGESTELVLGPGDANTLEPWRFAVMGDFQTALPSADEVFERVNEIPGLRFAMSTGDLVEDAELAEYDLLSEKLKSLDIPFFSTIGNHEVKNDISRWHDLFGRYNVHFEFKGVHFSFVDSGNASLDPVLYDRLDGWLEDGADSLHVFGTHFPPLDPIGIRSGSFRSRREANKLLSRLAGAGVDLTLYGHIHSYYAYENAGIPAYISGGGGALPERFDGVGRHFLVVDVDPIEGLKGVSLVRVD